MIHQERASTVGLESNKYVPSKVGRCARISCSFTTVIRVVWYHQINSNWWLNLWDKHITTGRINQVAAVSGRGRGEVWPPELAHSHRPAGAGELQPLVWSRLRPKRTDGVSFAASLTVSPTLDPTRTMPSARCRIVPGRSSRSQRARTRGRGRTLSSESGRKLACRLEETWACA